MKNKCKELTPKQAVKRLSGLSYKVTQQTKADVFAYYYGHVDHLEIHIHGCGWREDHLPGYTSCIEFYNENWKSKFLEAEKYLLDLLEV